MEDFKKKVHAEFEEKFSVGNEWKFEGAEQVKTFLDTQLDSLLVEVKGLVRKDSEVHDCYEGCGCRRRMIDALARFKGEEKI